MKTCIYCERTKPATSYDTLPASPDGLGSLCHECQHKFPVIGEQRYIRALNQLDWHLHREKTRQASHQHYHQQQSITSGARRKYRPWTRRDDYYLMRQDGNTVADKARMLGRTYSACVARRTHLRKAAEVVAA